MHTSSGARRFAASAPLTALLIVLLPALAAAQVPVTSFDQLNTRLKVGDTVWVTDAQGREIKGRVTSFAPDAMGVDANGAQVLRADEVRVVWNRRHDSLVNGALIGLGVGFGTGFGLAMAGCGLADCTWGEATLFALLFAGAGAGIGVGVDALIPGRRQVVFRASGASSSVRLSLAPLITPRTKGVALSYSF
jgi:hypothetical protein